MYGMLSRAMKNEEHPGRNLGLKTASRKKRSRALKNLLKLNKKEREKKPVETGEEKEAITNKHFRDNLERRERREQQDIEGHRKDNIQRIDQRKSQTNSVPREGRKKK